MIELIIVLFVSIFAFRTILAVTVEILKIQDRREKWEEVRRETERNRL